ncbi:MAG TPA: type II toxin-antitoxin system VapC family toxin [Candidatus Brocadiaceae bacterium]|nr:type II toxin-antitoxin system VapC family toxin [Candidatus Brocadiaceae bacterium]
MELKIVTLLKEIDSIFIDTAPFIYYIEEYEKYIETVDPLFSYISQGHITAYTSLITLIEVLTKPIEEKDKRLVYKYEELLTDSKGLILTDMDKNIAVESAKLRVKYRIKIPDAIQVTSGLVNGAKAFITNDSNLKKIKEIKVIVLDDIIK